VWFLFIFPTSYFLHIGYTESLFLALALGCFLAARTDRWWLAGLLGALVCGTRINGLLLVPALAVEALQVYRATRRWQWSWLWIAIVPLGTVVYLFLNLHVSGNAFQFMVFQREHWSKTLAFPWVGIAGTLDAISRNNAEGQMVGVQEFFFILLGLAATIWCCLKLRAAYGVWMAGNWLLFTSTSFILSVPRYTLVLFPIFILFAQLARRAFWRTVITVWSLLFLAIFIAQFVQGRWAF
jgi:Gpi18-like mannosyltransferase